MVRKNNKKKKGRGGKQSNNGSAAAAAASYDPCNTLTDIVNAEPDPESVTFSIFGREVPTDVYKKARNHAYVGIIEKIGTGIPDGMVLGRTTGVLNTEWCDRTLDAAYWGCYMIADEFYCNQPNYPATKFQKMNLKCSHEFAEKVAADIGQKYAENMEKQSHRAIKDTVQRQQQQQTSNGDENNLEKKPAAVIDNHDNDEKKQPAATTGNEKQQCGNTVADVDDIVTASQHNLVVATDGNTGVSLPNNYEDGISHVGSSHTNNDNIDEEKKPATKNDSTKDRGIEYQGREHELWKKLENEYGGSPVLNGNAGLPLKQFYGESSVVDENPGLPLRKKNHAWARHVRTSFTNDEYNEEIIPAAVIRVWRTAEMQRYEKELRRENEELRQRAEYWRHKKEELRHETEEWRQRVKGLEKQVEESRQREKELEHKIEESKSKRQDCDNERLLMEKKKPAAKTDDTKERGIKVQERKHELREKLENTSEQHEKETISLKAAATDAPKTTTATTSTTKTDNLTTASPHTPVTATDGNTVVSLNNNNEDGIGHVGSSSFTHDNDNEEKKPATAKDPTTTDRGIVDVVPSLTNTYQEFTMQRLLAYYTKYNPEKLDTINARWGDGYNEIDGDGADPVYGPYSYFVMQEDEKNLKDIFASFDLESASFNDFYFKDLCIDDRLLLTLISNEYDGSCVHGNTDDRYHISRPLEILLVLAHLESDNFLPTLIPAVERLAGVTLDDIKSDPDFAQFLVSTVTNLIRIDSDLKGTNVHFFCTMFLSKALEIKHKLYLDATIINNNEELHDGLRHLYGHNLLKYTRDTTSYRGVINICYRETKNNCDCMKPLWLVGKTLDKRRSCSGCRELFPKKELPYCRGCAFHQYCSYECSIKKCWVGQDQKQTCAMRDYIRCSTCRVIFPSDELSVHTCILDDDVIL